MILDPIGIGFGLQILDLFKSLLSIRNRCLPVQGRCNILNQILTGTL